MTINQDNTLLAIAAEKTDNGPVRLTILTSDDASAELLLACASATIARITSVVASRCGVSASRMLGKLGAAAKAAEEDRAKKSNSQKK